MPKLSTTEYDELKGFFTYFSERFFDMQRLAPELRPLAVLELQEKKSPAKAAAGLWMAIRDCLEMSERWDGERVSKLDTELKQRGLVTLSELRSRAERRRAGVLASRSKRARGG